MDVYIPGSSFIAKTAEDGSFKISNVPEGVFSIAAEKDGFAPVIISGISMVIDDESDDNKVLLSDITLNTAYGKIAGSVSFEGSLVTSSPLVNIKVTNLSDSSINYDFGSNSDGTFIKGSIKPGNYEVLFTPEAGYLPYKIDNVAISAAGTTMLDNVVIKANGGSVTGTVELYDNKSALGASAILINTENTVRYTTLVDENGNLFFQNCRPGSYNLTISKDGYSFVTIPVDISIGNETNIGVVTLKLGTGVITGKVYLDGGSDYSGTVVKAVSLGEPSKTYTVVSDEEGSFNITGIDIDGEYQIFFSHNGFISDSSKIVNVIKGKVAVVEPVTLKNIMGTLKGTILLEGSSSHEGTTILIKSTNNTTQYNSTTDQKGEFVVNNVQPGNYTLLISKDGYVSNNRLSVNVEPSSEKTLDPIMLSVAIRSITGKVDLELADDEAGALITATNTSDNTLIYSAISNTDGSFTLAGMKPGEYLVSISKVGYGTVTLPTINVIASTVAKIDTVSLLIDKGSIEGIVILEGSESDCSGVKVELLGTDYITYTEKDGSYSFEVPSKNYPGGLRFSKTDYELVSYSDTIPVLTNSAYAIPKMEMQATHTTINGIADVAGTDDNSLVRIYIEEYPSFDFVTEESGNFVFEHVPLGEVTIHFIRENAPEVISKFNLDRKTVNNIGTYEIIPQTASIKGRVVLNGIGSTDKIKVSVKTSTVEDIIETETDMAGNFYISNLLTSGIHTVTISKTGWDSVSFEVKDLVPLEIRSLTPETPITLYDNTAPILSKVEINHGASKTSDRNITVTLDALDEGSGLAKMRYSFDGRIDETVALYDYYPEFSAELPQGNEVKTLTVKVYDLAGNECDAAVTDQIELSGTEYTIDAGYLSGDDLKWTYKNSPYRITGPVKVPSGSELIIEPGVDVKFEGDSYLHIEGKLTAIGEAGKRISMSGTDGNFGGVYVRYDEGSKLSFIDIYNAKYGVYGYANIDNATIKCSEYALGGVEPYDGYSIVPITGTIKNTDADGAVKANKSTLFNTSITGFADFHTVISDNVSIEGELNSYYSSYVYCDANGAVTTYYDNFVYCDLSDISHVEWNGSLMRYSNFVMNTSVALDVKTLNADKEYLDLKDNYWGPVHTRELDEKKNIENADMTFIEDGMDIFSKSVVRFSDYKDLYIANAGYYGDTAFTPVDTGKTEYSIGDIGPGGGMVFYVDTDNTFAAWDYLETNIGYYGIGNYIFGYYRPNGSTNSVVGTATAIGSGKANTEALVAAMGDMAYSEDNGINKELYAAKIACDFDFGGLDDWFLPSKDELNLVYINIQKAGLCQFSGNFYWSSSEDGEYNAWAWDNTSQYYGIRNFDLYIRPIRAF